MSQLPSTSSKIVPLFASRFQHADAPVARRYNTFFELRFAPGGNPNMATIKVDRYPTNTPKNLIDAARQSYVLAYEIPIAIADRLVSVLTARLAGRNNQSTILSPTEVAHKLRELQNHPSWTQDGVSDLHSMLSQFRQDAETASISVLDPETKTAVVIQIPFGDPTYFRPFERTSTFSTKTADALASDAADDTGW